MDFCNINYLWDGIFKLLRSPWIKLKGIDFASLCSLAGRYDNPIPTQFLAPIDCYKIPAQSIYDKKIAFPDLRMEKIDKSATKWSNL